MTRRFLLRFAGLSIASGRQPGVVAGLQALRGAQPYPETITLQPVAAIDVPVSVSCSVKGFAANGAGLFFLTATFGNSEVLHTSHAGDVQKVMALPGPEPMYTSHGIAVDPAGNVVVLQASRRGTRLIFFDSSGTLMKQADLTHPIADLAFAGDLLVGLDLKKSLLLAEPDERPIFRLAFDLSLVSEIVGLSSNRLAVIETDVPRMHVIDLGAGVGRTLPLSAPEIPGPPRQPLRPPADLAKVLLYSTVPDGRGGFVSSGPGYSRKTGAKILHFDADGNVRGRYRCLFDPRPRRCPTDS